MAQQVLVRLIDDLDGTSSPDVSTVEFSVDGVRYEIDLTDANAERLRNSLADYVASARRVGGRIKRPRKAGAAARTAGSGEAGAIREWALQNGIELAARGRIPMHVVDDYKKAKAGDKPKDKSKRTTKSAGAPAKRRTRKTT